MNPSPSVISRFWDKVDKSGGPNACWLWMGGRNYDGYGIAFAGHGAMGAHRLAYIIENGGVPAGLLVCHTCDNPSCVNPAHLWAGTQQQNLKDSVDKGRRYVKGIRGGPCRRNMKVDIADILPFISRLPLRPLARAGGLNYGTLWQIVHNQRSKVHYSTAEKIRSGLIALGIASQVHYSDKEL